MANEIVGRREELTALGAFLDAAPAGGQALLFEGDAGIGKTALWQEGVRLARERGFRVLTARASQSELQMAFATVADLFAPVLDEALPRLVPVQRHALEVAFMIREADGPAPDGRLLATALLSIVDVLAHDAPLVVALDDQQWIDASSRELLEFVLRRLEDEPVGVLMTVRGRPVQAPFELDRAFVGFRQITVPPFSVAATQRLLWGRLALNLPRPVLVRVHDATGGNPFFALEVGRALVAGTIRADGVQVFLPPRLRALVEGRVSSLPARVRETLAAVAALGAPSVTLLEPLAPTTVEDVELARRRGLVELDGDRIRFTHPLLAPVCYEDLPLHRRRLLHSRLADLDVDPEERARHLAIAAAGPDEAIAVALDEAALHARRRGGVQAAAELAQRAIALTPSNAPDRVNRRRITAGELSFYAGDKQKAAKLLEEAAGSSTAGPIRVDALCTLAVVTQTTEGKRRAAEIYSRALAEPGLEPRQRAYVLCELACLAASAGDAQDIALADEALALAEELAEPDILVFALVTVASITFWHTGRSRSDLLERALELEGGAGGARRFGRIRPISLVVAGTPRATLAWQLGRSGRFDEARAIWRELIDEADERTDPELGAYLFFLARMEVMSGGWAEARRLCDEAIQVGRETGRELVESLCLNVVAEVEALKGDAAKARREIPGLLRVAERAGYSGAIHDLRRSLGVLELSSGDAAASWRQVESLFAGAGELHELDARVAGSCAIEALIALGDRPRAERLLRRLEAVAAEADTPLRPLAGRCRGVLQAARGDREGAIATLTSAVEDPDSPQRVNPFELARTLLALGTVQRRAQHKRAAHESLQRATEIFEQLGARLWLEQARSELRRIGGRTASDDELSETERRIVELVVAGRRNREVADELSLSPNTIAWNLSKVYRKLGVTSRTELAAHVAATPPM